MEPSIVTVDHAHVLRDALRDAQAFASDDPSLPIITSVFVRIGVASLTLVGTNRYALIERTIACDHEGQPREVLIPARSVTAILAVFEAGDVRAAATLSFDEQTARLGVASVSLSVDLGEDASGFPNYQALWPKPGSESAEPPLVDPKWLGLFGELHCDVDYRARALRMSSHGASAPMMFTNGDGSTRGLVMPILSR